MRPRALGAALALGVVVYLLVPVQVVTQGAGFVQPVFEEVVPVTPTTEAMVAAVYVTRWQRVDEGDALLGFVPWPDFAVQPRGQRPAPGAQAAPAPELPAWHSEAEARRLARQRAASRWQTRLHATDSAAGSRPSRWELALASRLSLVTSREDEVSLEALWAAERTRQGRHDDNKVRTFDRTAGGYRSVDDGQPSPSPVSGVVASLWATPLLQVSSSHPVAEIMRDGTPIEVLGLVRAGSRIDVDPPPTLTRLELQGLAPTLPSTLSAVAVGRVPLDEVEARQLFPELAVRGPTTFIRLRLAGPVPPPALGRAVNFELVNRSRPRIWIWLQHIARRR